MVLSRPPFISDLFGGTAVQECAEVMMMLMLRPQGSSFNSRSVVMISKPTMVQLGYSNFFSRQR